jgi:hypothetical protein
MNKLFTGAFANIDGLVLYDTALVPNTQDTASGSKYGAAGTVEGATAILMGAQALGFAKIGEGDWEESDNQDYKNKIGISYGRFIGFRKPKFKSIYDANASEDFSVLVLYTAAAK